MTLEQLGEPLVFAGGGSDQAVHAPARRGKEDLAELDLAELDLAELDADVWRLARQLRAEWRRERYARLKPLRRNRSAPLR